MNITPHVSRWDKFLLRFLKSFLPKVEALENTVSIIIQGPLNHRSINTIPAYLTYGQVIVSCWDTDDISILDPFIDDIDLVVNNFSSASSLARRTHLKNPIIFQNYTTHKALELSKGYFSIKTRSDESWPVLDPLLNMLKTNRDYKDPKTGLYNNHKIITSNIYFRYDKQCKFHPSDHLIAGTTCRMKELFDRAFCDCCLGKIKGLGPEQLIARSAISTYFNKKNKSRDEFDPNRSIELMKKHFDIIRISALPRHTWTSSYRKYDSLYHEEDWCHHINEIDKYN
jgi:hypothetical protein